MTAFVLLHGFAQTPASWDAAARQLQAAGHRTYVPDLYRRSDLSLESLCAYVAEVAGKVAQADGAPVLVGYSMGGRLAAETVVRHPDLPLAGLVLESAGLGPADEAARAALVERNGEWAQRLRREGVPSFMDWWKTLPLFASQQALPAKTRAAVRTEREAHTADELARSLEAWGAQHQASEADTLSALRVLQERGIPALYLAGALDEKYAAVAARVRAAGLPAMLVPDAGHNVHLEAPAPFLEALDAPIADLL
ncbi:MAG: alpha/beta fold hydrolase [Adlercreutzia sp.]|nr:alpha/beta fold hydrolase [Adlercreutzia sp.]